MQKKLITLLYVCIYSINFTIVYASEQGYKVLDTEDFYQSIHEKITDELRKKELKTTPEKIILRSHIRKILQSTSDTSHQELLQRVPSCTGCKYFCCSTLKVRADLIMMSNILEKIAQKPLKQPDAKNLLKSMVDKEVQTEDLSDL